MANINNDMDEFVNWDDAAAAVGTGFEQDPSLTATSNDPEVENIRLALANVAEDDFSFSALEHFSASNFPMMDTMPTDGTMPLDLPAASEPAAPEVPSVLYWEDPVIPCANCTLSGFSCKKIREGRYKGYCTSCVALRVECSFGNGLLDSLNQSSTAFLDPSLNLFEANQVTALPGQLTETSSMHSSSNLDLTQLAGTSDTETGIAAPKPLAPPKIGARFSRESVRILKNWLHTHNRHPYPSDEEKEMLQRQTGLNKTQITNWLANARRRGKVQPPRPTSPQIGSWAGGIDIPQRRGTPALEAMNPLQRWEHSPPEHEPASVTAIARAVTASSSGVSSGLNSPFSFNYTDDGSGKSLCNQSSASSLGTSQSSGGISGGSMQSAYSHGSRNSWGSFGSAPFNHSRGRRRRRRRATANHGADGKTSLAVPLKTFQCTFCTETFRTKHDWQRHEKSLHLSLERWVCTPNGPRAVQAETGAISCVFCGLANPSDEHIESHNHAACQERTLGERTFYRKDHLNQHLRLVHNVKFMEATMKSWKVASPEIRSRCGFCGIVMDTWTIRVDHLADHFKTGYSMADWKGDWGFDVPVLEMVENSIPPYLIHHERATPLPFAAGKSPPESPRNAYELIKLEMAYFGTNHLEQHGRQPTDEEMMVEGCRIIFASELLSLQGIATQASWLRDLIMKSDDLAQKARFGPLRGAAENRLATLKINGKDNLFEACPMEFQLHEFVRAKRLLGLTAMDGELQEEACRIVGRVEEVSTNPSDAVANWILRLIMSSTDWMAPFRRRAHLPRSEDVQDEIIRSTDPTSIDSTIHSYSRLERELADFLKMQRALGHEPSDEDLQQQARIIIYEFDDGWNQTAADNVTWLDAFRQRHPASGSPAASGDTSINTTVPSARSAISGPSSTIGSTQSSRRPMQQTKLFHVNSDQPHRSSDTFLHDANCFNRLAKELARWVASTMSPNNPNQHVPTDAELQYQARWILYDDDDPWNQTAADNAEWLQRFKRDHGIIKEDGPGLPLGAGWSLQQGGSGFAPPYAYPKGHMKRFEDNMQVTVGPKSFSTGHSTVNDYLGSLTSRYPKPATIFCSRELEDGLVAMVEKHVSDNGCLPTDAALQSRAREIVKSDTTAAEDPVLLQKFKDWMREKFPGAAAAGSDDTSSDEFHTALPSNMDLNLSDEELGHILEDMNFEMDTEDFGGIVEEADDMGGVSLGGFGKH